MWTNHEDSEIVLNLTSFLIQIMDGKIQTTIRFKRDVIKVCQKNLILLRLDVATVDKSHCQGNWNASVTRTGFRHEGTSNIKMISVECDAGQWIWVDFGVLKCTS